METAQDLKVVSSISVVGAEAWRRLESPDYPFADYRFLEALEVAGCVGKGTGWQPAYVVAGDLAAPEGVALAYVKTHSYGEYIFDWQWARFYEANGADYYPKLTVAVPFTPATGPRLLLAPGAPPATRERLVAGTLELCRAAQL